MTHGQGRRFAPSRGLVWTNVFHSLPLSHETYGAAFESPQKRLLEHDAADMGGERERSFVSIMRRAFI